VCVCVCLFIVCINQKQQQQLKKEKLPTYEDGVKLAQTIGAKMYLECSALTQEVIIAYLCMSFSFEILKNTFVLFTGIEARV
jgi:hypothetical protein